MAIDHMKMETTCQVKGMWLSLEKNPHKNEILSYSGIRVRSECECVCLCLCMCVSGECGVRTYTFITLPYCTLYAMNYLNVGGPLLSKCIIDVCATSNAIYLEHRCSQSHVSRCQAHHYTRICSFPSAAALP